MGAGHGHGHLDDQGVAVRARPWPAALLVGLLAAVGVATVVAMVVMWPGRPDVGAQYLDSGASLVAGEVRAVQDSCPDGGGDAGAGQEGQGSSQGDGRPECGQLSVRLSEGSQRGRTVTVQVPPQVAESGLSAGDRVQVLQTAPDASGQPSYSFQSVDRNLPLGILAGVFVVVVALVARWRGLLAILGLVVGAFVLVRFMLPALLDGSPGLLVAVVGSSAIMFVVLYLAHGLSVRTSTALAGTLIGVALTGAIGLVMIRETRLSGVADESAAFLTTFVPDLDFRGLLICAVIVAGLGVLNDVTITQASAVWELRGAAPHLTRRELFSRGMRIGRDHIASTIYTIVFAYSGAALAVLLLVYIYRQPAGDLLSLEQFAEEVARTLASAIGLVLAVPITTAIAVLTIGEPAEPYEQGRPAGSRGKHL